MGEEMTTLARYEEYKALKVKYPWAQPTTIGYWMKPKKDPMYFDTMAYEGHSERFDIPGLGWLSFKVYNDDSRNDDDWSTTQWVHTDDLGEYRHKYDCGAYVGDNMYSTGETDRSSVLVVRFNKACNSRLEDRVKYNRCTMTRHEAWLKAITSIREDCKRHADKQCGNIYNIGAEVKLYDKDDEELDEESCWGYESDDAEHVLDEVNGWATNMVQKAWKAKYKDPAPHPYPKGVNSLVDAAWQAWHTAMATSDDDTELASQLFVSTYQEGLHHEWCERHVHIARRFQTCA